MIVDYQRFGSMVYAAPYNVYNISFEDCDGVITIQAIENTDSGSVIPVDRVNKKTLSMLAELVLVSDVDYNDRLEYRGKI